MISVDLATHRVSGGFFVTDQRNVKPRPYVWAREQGRSCEIVGTYKGSGAPLRERLVRMIREATETVFVASFMLGDEALIAELLSAAERLKGGVYVITALDEASLRRGLREYDEAEQAPPEERRKNFERLTSGGIYVRGHEECHAKFAVVDRRAALVGSANFVANAFDHTGELNVVVRDPAQVQQVRRYFTELWYKGCTWEVPPGSVYTVSQRKPACAPIQPNQGDYSDSRLVWTNGPEAASLLAAIREVIDAAQEELLLSTYSIVGMTQHPTLIVEHLSRAVSRGVRVKLFIRQRNAYPEQVNELLALHDLGVEIHGDTRNHAKVVVADRRLSVVFSANFDANHGLDSGVEAGVRLGDREFATDVARYLDHAISNADTTFLRNPTLAELDGKLAARWCSEWSGDREISMPASPRLFDIFSRQAIGTPFLFEQAEDGKLTVFAGDVALRITSGKVPTVLEILPENQTTTQRLHEWLRSVRQTGNEIRSRRRGFCTAVIVCHED